VFTGLGSGWSPSGAHAVEAEDIAAHMEQIDDPGRFTTPDSAWVELAQLATKLRRR
jgi:hypothetical protein